MVFSFSWELKWPQGKLKTMLLQNFGVTNKEYYGMLWYFLERPKEGKLCQQKRAAKLRIT